MQDEQPPVTDKPTPPADQPPDGESQVTTPPPTSTPDDTIALAQPAARPLFKKRRFWFILAIVVILVLGATAYWVTRPTATSTTLTHSSTTMKKSLSGDTYYASAKQLGDLKFFADLGEVFGTDCTNVPSQQNCPLNVKASDIQYYQIGETATGQAIIGIVDPAGGEGSFSYLALQNGSDYKLLVGMTYASTEDINSSQAWLNTLKKGLSPNVQLDTSTILSGLQFPMNVSVGGAKLISIDDTTAPIGNFITDLTAIRGYYNNQPLSPTNLHPIGQSNGKTYYRAVVDKTNNYQVEELYGAKSTFFVAQYRLVDPLMDSGASKPHITWNTGDKDVAQYTSRPEGCGSAYGYVVANNIDKSQLTVEGTGSNGQPIYALSTNDPLYQEIFTQDYAGGTNLDDKSLQNLTADQFQTKHGVFVAQNAFGEYQVYIRADIVSGGGCGKPVIYLYPTVPTSVNVQVGADITQSIPNYPLGGWNNVFALPDSRLLYRGQGYPYLFWEGLGRGTYPIIDFGSVVKTSDAVATIRSELAAQGLRSNEISDFLAYWAPKLPTTPYVRLSWLNTAQMDNLAPLHITPRPQTVIRVFLDFQGLNEPMALPQQTFQPIARHGFTVVEWGGLLHNH